jgi:hypothetical protein
VEGLRVIKSNEGVTYITNQEYVQSTKEIAVKYEESLSDVGIDYQTQLLNDLRMEQQETM